MKLFILGFLSFPVILFLAIFTTGVYAELTTKCQYCGKLKWKCRNKCGGPRAGIVDKDEFMDL